jgi:hypothetical protein
VPAFCSLPQFQSDFDSLGLSDQEAFLDAFTQFVEDLEGPEFRKSLRVKGVLGKSGVFEMSWAADGSATFHYGASAHLGEPNIVWRRVGKHAIFNGP